MIHTRPRPEVGASPLDRSVLLSSARMTSPGWMALGSEDQFLEQVLASVTTSRALF